MWGSGTTERWLRRGPRQLQLEVEVEVEVVSYVGSVSGEQLELGSACCRPKLATLQSGLTRLDIGWMGGGQGAGV
jgi:hypothetical protein